LQYDVSAPILSLNDNKDKIIIKGNPKKKMVALVVDHNEEVKNYLKQNNIKYTLIANSEDVIDKKEEYINGETDEELFSNLNSILNHKKVNSKLCLVGKSNLELCKYSIDMDNNLIKNVNEVSAGDIIYVSPNSALAKLKVLLNEISRVDLEITYLSKLISEEN